ncbi:c-type cytochrome [Ottowia thiooxydans]|uniref:Cytochrome c n=1 Tax=Ottowia thiooxydans TaxID=219182 RepID=A0ABV2Q363_9BURK
MPLPKLHNLLALLAVCSALSSGGVLAAQPAKANQQSVTGVKPAYGQHITEADLAHWNIDIRTKDGAGLPPGSGTIEQGKNVYESKCASCHGEKAAGGAMFGTMVGGIGSFTTNTRVLTPGSMYPYAPALFDYVRRAMPLLQPQSLSNEEVYGVTGYILHLNGLLPADAVVDAKLLSELKMPNRNGFIIDDRPDVKATRCMKNCAALR